MSRAMSRARRQTVTSVTAVRMDWSGIVKSLHLAIVSGAMVAPQAISGASVAPRNPYGLLRVVSNQQLEEEERRQQELRNPSQPEAQYTGLAGYIKTQWDMMVRHRNTVAGWSDRLLAALRAFNGQYDPQKLAEIRKFGGSEVYARLIAAKCRGATALLRDVYLGAERSWGLNPPQD